MKHRAVRGHPENPLTWEYLREKFAGLVEPVLGTGKTGRLFAAASELGTGSLERILSLLTPR